MLQYAFFPGCLIPAKYPQFELAIRKTLPALGIEIIDLKGFTCCPDPIHFKAADKLAWLTIAARNLSIAEQAGLEIFTICSGCTATLSETTYLLEENRELKDEVNRRLSRIGRKYSGTIRARHIVTVLRDDVGFEKIRQSVKFPLEDVSVAIHYGCHLLKPSMIMNVDNPDDPRILDELVIALGATVKRHKERYLCCGKACVDENLPEQMTKTVLDSIKEEDCDCMGVICPSCFSEYDLGQIQLEKKYNIKYDIPPVYYFQLMGLSQGLSFDDVGLNRHKLKPVKIKEKIELIRNKAVVK